jgi:hypothetical protein
MLGQIIDTNNILALGTLNKVFQWYCTLENKEATDILVQKGKLDYVVLVSLTQ